MVVNGLYVNPVEIRPDGWFIEQKCFENFMSQRRDLAKRRECSIGLC